MWQIQTRDTRKRTSPAPNVGHMDSHLIDWDPWRIYTYTYTWINVLSQLSPKWLCSNSCSWALDVQLHELPQSYYGDNQEDTMPLWHVLPYCDVYMYMLWSSWFVEIWVLSVFLEPTLFFHIKAFRGEVNSQSFIKMLLYKR